MVNLYDFPVVILVILIEVLVEISLGWNDSTNRFSSYGWFVSL